MASDQRKQDNRPPATDSSGLDLAAAVHDVRQMLAVISGRAGLLLHRSDDEETRAHLHTIELAAMDAGAMLGRLGAVGRAPAQGSPANLKSAVLSAVVMTIPPQTDPSLTVTVTVPPDLTVGLSAQVVREVLTNLLLNSRAVMPAGGEILLAAESRGDRIILRLTDTGPGISPDMQDRIFEVGVSRTGTPGRGIGLAGCRRLLAGCNAGLKLAGTSAAGSVFELDLPTGRPVPATRADTGAPLTVNGQALSVLVVDDDAAVRDMMTDLLGELGCRVTVVPDGRAVAEALAGTEVQVAFLDQNLPGKSGVEIASWIRKTYPAIFLVLVTGWGNDALLREAPVDLMDAAVEKPLTVGIIRDLLRLALDQSGGPGSAR